MTQSPETTFLLAVLRAGVRGGAPPQAPAGLRWDAVLRLAQTSHLLGPLHRHLRLVEPADVPAGVGDSVRRLFLAASRRSVRLTDRLGDILALARARDIPLLVLRGPVLSQILHGDPAARYFADIDLLVRPQHFSAARRILEELGLSNPNAVRPHAEPALVHFGYEMPFAGEDARLIVDLHWRSFDPVYDFEPRLDRLFRDRITVDVGGMSVPTVSDEDRMLSLALHLAKHGWLRLDHLFDVTLMARRPLRIERLLRLAARAGRQRILFAVLELAQDLLAAPVAPELRERARRLGGAGRLARRARRAMIGALEGRPPDTLQLRALELAGLERVGDICETLLLASLRPTARELRLVALPRPLWPLYYPLRLARLTVRIPRYVLKSLMR
jgi:hypothetical protein